MSANNNVKKIRASYTNCIDAIHVLRTSNHEANASEYQDLEEVAERMDVKTKRM